MKSLMHLLCLAAVSAVPASASSINFELRDMVFDHSAVTGSVNIDTGSGQFVSANVTVTTGGESFELRRLEKNNGSNWFGVFAGGPAPELWIALPVSNVIGYDGSAICGVGTPGCHLISLVDYQGHPDYLASGELAHAPEPASLWLIGTGLLGGATMLRSRKRLPHGGGVTKPITT